jgi:cell division protein FtsI/penicillin-binding protein 2/cell division protein FtsW (lipid II flippase)
MLLLLITSAVIVGLLWLAFAAKSSDFDSYSKAAAAQQIIDLNAHPSPEQILPVVVGVGTPDERRFIADRISERAQQGRFSHVGELALSRVTGDELAGRAGLDDFAKRIAASKTGTTTLLTRTELHDLKPFFSVRTPTEFIRIFWLYTGGLIIGFFLLHLFWRLRGFAGDQLILPGIELLCGLGVVLMLSIGDPLRDSLQFVSFCNGIFLGIAAMLVLSTLDYNRRFRRFSYIFIVLTVALGALLWIFGKGPSGSDAKVTLFGFFEPVEVMRLLIVAFLAGYLGENWSAIRDMRSRTGPLARRLRIPRVDYILPIAVGVSLAATLFYLVKDNGPALVIGVLFLLMYAIARKRALGACVGFLLIIGVFWLARAEHFETVAARIEMWSSPWRNTIPGGDQVAQSLWAIASGGTWGAGPGRGSAAEIPAGSTDLILASAGEEFGFVGLAVIFALYGLLIWRGLRIALNASGPYGFFLAIGMTLVITLQLLLIAGGILGLVPLSGVVSPFLCFGKSSMVANFAAFAVLLAISSRGSVGAQKKSFALPTYIVASLIAACWIVILVRVGYIQILKSDETIVRDAEVRYRNGTLGLEYNPRLNDALREVARGDVVDRNGLPLATSRWETLERYRAAYQKLGVDIDSAASRGEVRHYPLGPEFFYLVGDMRSGLQSFIRTNAVERASRKRLLGFDDHVHTVRLIDDRTPKGEQPAVYNRATYDFHALIPLVRYGLKSNNPQVRAFLSQNRDVKMSIDAGLQLQVSSILKNHLAAGQLKGAAVVLDPDTGDLLASVSYPWPEQDQFALFRKNADRTIAADWQDRALFGLYPPGSSFKIVTAIAALRQNPNADRDVFECRSLGDGRVGNYVGRSKRPIRDDVQDKIPHGRVDMTRGIIVSCNAFFAQLGYEIGAAPLLETAELFRISASPGNSLAQLRLRLPQAAYGQGEVVATPFQMARVAATVADNGTMPQGRWVIDESNTRAEAPTAILDVSDTQKIAAAMRQVVASPAGTGKILRTAEVAIAGKTGTAQLDRGSAHAWFIGYAPYGATQGKRIAFAVLVEHGEYGGKTAAPIAGEIVKAAQQAGFVK